MSNTKSTLSARERLLRAADVLFYEDGIHTVGIDRVIERAGVAKASLYSTFGSKDELVRAYLEGRSEQRRGRILRRLEREHDPKRRVLSIYDALHDRVLEKDFRGCAFINASAEGKPESTEVARVSESMRAWFRDLVTNLVREAGVKRPERLVTQLVMLYDGALVAASMDGNTRAPRDARATAEVLIDLALAT